ncbi:MAG: alpha/beta hydrolase fold domain-containing protein [Christensenellaceae bacterium]|jgi:hypothetical protein|nr:alpha/beta hydrolase fold domain-containing protein [Christensenellaceae bacterium]
MAIKLNGKDLPKILFPTTRARLREIGYETYHSRLISGICNIRFDKLAPSYSTIDVFKASNNNSKPTVFYVSSTETSKKDRMRRGLSHFIARDGFDVIALRCGIQFPRNVVECLNALEWIQNNKSKLGIDFSKVILAGDSIGGFALFSLVTAMSNPNYAALLGIKPFTLNIVAESYFCGLFDIPRLYDAANTRRDQRLINKMLRKFPIDFAEIKKSTIPTALSPTAYMMETRSPIFVTHTDFDKLYATQGLYLIRAIHATNSPYYEVRAIKAAMKHNWQLNIKDNFGKSVLMCFGELMDIFIKVIWIY